MNEIYQQKVDQDKVLEDGVDYSAISKLLSELNLLRAIHNPSTSGVMNNGAVVEAENPKYHNEPTHLHIRYVGSVMSTLLQFRPYVLDEFPSKMQRDFFGYDQDFIDILEGVKANNNLEDFQTEEMRVKRLLFRKALGLVERANVGHDNKTALFLWAYLHDSGKILRPEVKQLRYYDSRVEIVKDYSNKTRKTPNRLYRMLQLEAGDYNKYEILDKLNYFVFQVIEEIGAVNQGIMGSLKALQYDYENLTAILKGYRESDYPIVGELNPLALIAVVADELGKGNYFEDESGHSQRIAKYNLLLSIFENYDFYN